MSIVGFYFSEIGHKSYVLRFFYLREGRCSQFSLVHFPLFIQPGARSTLLAIVTAYEEDRALWEESVALPEIAGCM